MREGLISVIITTYGFPKYLKNSIKSVFNQSYQNFELIIVDDNGESTKNQLITKKIIHGFKDFYINYIIHDKNLNGSAARNTGLKAAKGEIVSFLDNDDLYHPDRFLKCINTLKKKPNYNAVYTGCSFLKSNKVYLNFKNVKSGNYLVETLSCEFMFCSGSNLFIKKNIIDELNGFDEKFLRHQDYEFLVRYFEKYEILSIKEILLYKNNENINRPSVEKMISIKDQYLSKYSKIISSLPFSQQRKIFQKNYVELAEQALVEGKFEISKDFYTKASKIIPLTPKQFFRKLYFKLK